MSQSGIVPVSVELPTTTSTAEITTEIASAKNVSTDETSSQIQLNSSVQSSSSGGSAKRHRNRSRKRKRDLYRKIRDQIGYYFSNSNLRHDRFMRKLTGVDLDGFDADDGGEEEHDDELLQHGEDLSKTATADIQTDSTNTDLLSSVNNTEQEVKPGTKPVSLPLFLKFNKISELTNDQYDIVKAFKYNFNSQQPALAGPALVFNEEQNTISRSEPFYNQDNHEANIRTVYVEGFSAQTADDIHDWLRKVFRKFISFNTEKSTEDEVPNNGSDRILSIRTPRYRHTRQLMGFGFVEFNDQSLVPLVCQNVENFISEKLQQKHCDEVNDLVEENKKDNSNIKAKKQKLNDEGEEEEENNIKCEITMTENNQQQTVLAAVENCDNLIDKQADSAKIVKNQKPQQLTEDLNCNVRNNVALLTENALICGDDEISKLISQLDDIAKFRVMSKSEWIKYKNRYLKLQREALAQLRWSSFYQYEDRIPPSHHATNSWHEKTSLARQQGDDEMSKRYPVSSGVPSTDSNKNQNETNQTIERVGQTGESLSKVETSTTTTTIVHYSDPIVQIQFTILLLADADVDRIRKSFRSIFEKCSDSLTTPSLKEICYIDISASMCSFNDDGTVQQKCFIRVRNADAVTKLQSEQFCKNLEVNLLNGSCRNFKILLLNEEQTSQYWQTVNSLKARAGNKHGKKV